MTPLAPRLFPAVPRFVERTFGRFVCVVALCSATSALVHAAVPTPEAIRALIAENRVEEAITASREKIAAQPKDPEGHVLLANALFKKARVTAGALPDGRPAPLSKADAEAIAAELEEGIRIAPTRKDIYLGLVDVWSAAGRDEDMLRQIQRSATQFPSDSKMMNGLLDYGFERQARGDAFAARIIETLYKSYPRAQETILGWSSYLLNTGDLDKSIQVLESGTVTNPGNAELQEALGDAYCYRLDFETAAKTYAKASAIDTKRRPVKLSWAAALHVFDPKSAHIVVDPLKDEGGKSGVAPTMQMGKDGVKMPGRITRAAEQLVRALNNPQFGGIEAYTLAKAFWQSALAPAALAETQVALLKDPLIVEAWMLRADIFGRAGLDKQALDALERAEGIFDVAGSRTFAYSRDEVIAARAATLGRLGRDEDGVKAYKRTSDPSRYGYQTAILLERLGKTDEARELLEQVIAKGGNPAEVEAAKSRLNRDSYRKKP